MKVLVTLNGFYDSCTGWEIANAAKASICNDLDEDTVKGTDGAGPYI